LSFEHGCELWDDQMQNCGMRLLSAQILEPSKLVVVVCASVCIQDLRNNINIAFPLTTNSSLPSFAITSQSYSYSISISKQFRYHLHRFLGLNQQTTTPINTTIMLRRQPTKITLVQDDIATYDANKLRKDQEKNQQQRGDINPFGNSVFDPSKGPRKDTRTKEQRLGLSRN
jgi:hypothetical protein